MSLIGVGGCSWTLKENRSGFRCDVTEGRCDRYNNHLKFNWLLSGPGGATMPGQYPAQYGGEVHTYDLFVTYPASDAYSRSARYDVRVNVPASGWNGIGDILQKPMANSYMETYWVNQQEPPHDVYYQCAWWRYLGTIEASVVPPNRGWYIGNGHTTVLTLQPGENSSDTVVADAAMITPEGYFPFARPSSSSRSSSSACSLSCTDSDGGFNRGTRGNVTVTYRNCQTLVDTDVCISQCRDGRPSGAEDKMDLWEFLCDDETHVSGGPILLDCPNGCVDGACLPSPNQSSSLSSCAPSCIDSDGGQNFTTKGRAIETDGNCQTMIMTDVCSNFDKSILWEYDCHGFNGVRILTPSSYKCPKGCVDGACR